MSDEENSLNDYQIHENMDYINNNYFDTDINNNNLNDFQGFNALEDNQRQIENFQSSSESSSRLYFINKNNINNDSIKKEEEKLLNKKTKRKIFDCKKIPNPNRNRSRKKYKTGRRLRIDYSIRKHNCSSKDNIMNKIKTHFFHYIRDIIKKNSIYEEINFIKFQTKFVANMKKDINIELLEAKLVDIIKNQPISTKNSKSEEYHNRIIIDKIYEEKKEVRIMKILELTLKELFIIYRKKLKNDEDRKELKIIANKIEGLDLITNNDYDDIKYLEDDIEKKNKRMTEVELNEYKEKVKKACSNYENWFYQKYGRKLK